MERLSNILLNFIEKNTSEKIEDRDIVLFGLQIIISSLIDIFIICIMGFLANYGLEALIYLCVFSLIKGNAGGYHAKSMKECIILTIGTFAMTLLIAGAGIWKYSKIVYIIFTAFSILILVLTPVESIRNKIPEENARHRRKRIVVIIFLIDVLSIVIAYSIKIYFMLMAAIWSGLMVSIGKLYNDKEGKKNEKICS